MSENYCNELIRWLCEEPGRDVQEDAAFLYLGAMLGEGFDASKFHQAWSEATVICRNIPTLLPA